MGPWQPDKQLWEVVGGASKGGILVREGESTGSQELGERLSRGAWVQEEDLRGQRLLYTLLVGSGPASGWVSLRLNQQELLARRRGPPPGVELAEAAAGAASRPEATSSAATAVARPSSSPSDTVVPVAVDFQGSGLLQVVTSGINVSAFLRLPWDFAAFAPTCKVVDAVVAASREAWSEVRPLEQREVPYVCKMVRRAGQRLRVLDLSGVQGRKLGPTPELGAALRFCPELEALNVAGWDKLSFARSEDVLPQLARSLRRLNIQGCSALHGQLPSLLGRKLEVLEAGWRSEGDQERVWKEWTAIFPSNIFRTISQRCPNLVRIRFPGYALYHGQPESQVQRLLREYVEIGGLANLRSLQRVNLSCAQLLEDPPIVRIATGCKRLRSLGLRNCENVTDKGLQAIADNLGGSLAHINISCCMFSERTVRRLILRCRGLKTLDLCYCRGIGRQLMKYLFDDPALCPQLSMIGAGGMGVTDSEVSAMCKKYSGTLVHLGIGSCDLTDAGLKMLAGLPHLRRISAHQLKRVSARGMINMCLESKSLTDVDAEGCEYVPEPSPREKEELEKVLKERFYDYDAVDEESDGEEAEKERLKKEKEEKEKAERERRKKEKEEREQKPQNLLMAMGAEMANLL